MEKRSQYFRGVENSSVILISLILNLAPTLVVCDFIIKDLKNGDVAFQTASDFIRSENSCATLTSEAYLVPYQDSEEPLCDKINVPSPPKLWVGKKSYLWVLLVLDEQDTCKLRDLYKLRRESGRKGYSGLIFGTSRNLTKHLQQYKIDKQNEEGLIDMHLVNPFDIPLIFNNFSFPKSNFVVGPAPPSPKCQPVKDPTTLEILSGFGFRLSDYLMSESTTYLKTIHRELSKSELFLLIGEFIARVLIGIGYTLLVCFCGGIVLWLGSLYEITSFFFSNQTPGGNQERRGRRESPPRSNNNYRSSSGSPPRFRQSYDPFLSNPTIRHRINLGLSLWEPLTIEMVNSRFRQLARTYHPDKNLELHPSEVAQREEEFKSKKNSRDFLIRHIEGKLG